MNGLGGHQPLCPRETDAHRIVLFWRLAKVQNRCFSGSMPSSFASCCLNSTKVVPFRTLSCLTYSL